MRRAALLMIPAVALAQTAPPQLVGIVVAPGYRAARVRHAVRQP